MPPINYAALIAKFRPSPGYEISIGASLAKVCELAAENNCRKQTNKQPLHKYIQGLTININDVTITTMTSSTHLVL